MKSFCSFFFIFFFFVSLFFSSFSSLPVKSLSHVLWNKKKVLIGSQKVTLRSTRLRFGQVSKNVRSDSGDLAIEIRTRGYNGEIPGPTMTLKRGEYYEVILQNTLENPTQIGFNDDFQFNSFRYPNFTNIHLHGLHISPLPGSDYPFEVVSPIHSFRYLFHVPEDHMGGTFWYHPHFHGIFSL